MSFPHSHKATLVLDHAPRFLKPCKEMMEFDVFTKSRAPGFIPQAPLSKSLWTCNVEAILEFARIIYDIFPSGKLLRYISSDQEAKTLNTWAQQEQNLQQAMAAFALVGPPDKRMDPDDCNIIHGLNQAIECLCEPSEKQQEIEASATDGESDAVTNRGRMIVLTSLKNDSHVRTLEACVQDALSQHNKLAAQSENLLPVHHCELVFIHVMPVGSTSNVSAKERVEISPILTSEVHVSQSGPYIASKLVEIAMNHYELSSTTITGIPMKEEQNASSSANYDVELLHSNKAHNEVVKSGQAEGLIVQSKEGLYTSTLTLKWCTPKSNAVELHQCVSASRVTPVDVNSRPSSCLTNFLLNGRSVMLEQPRKSGNKLISHMLTSHGGEIYIHSLNTARVTLEDPPSISEGCGGRVTDYRIKEFGELMKESRLAPVADSSELPEKPLERAKMHLDRMTKYWPMVIGDTIIFNMASQIDPLQSLITKERLTEQNVLDCKSVIYHLIGMESKNEPLPVPLGGTRGKGPKRDEQYRQMWSELEKFLRVHAGTSPEHEKVLDCLLECKQSSRASSPKKIGKIKEEETEQALRELESYNKLTEREKSELNKPDSLRSDIPPAKRFKPTIDFGKGAKAAGGQSLLSMWTSRLSTMHSQRRAEFAGRAENPGSNKAELYLSLKEKLENGDGDAQIKKEPGIKKEPMGHKKDHGGDRIKKEHGADRVKKEQGRSSPYMMKNAP